MWKVVTSSNLNPPLKLFFYSPILINNNILLKIYCDNIFQLGFLFYFLYYFFHFHPRSLSFFLFSFFSTFHFQNLPLYFFLQLSPIFLFFFYHYLQTHTDMHGEKGEIALAPPYRHHFSSSSPLLLHHTHTSLFFFS